MSLAAIPDQIGDRGESRFSDLLARLAQESGFAAAGIAAVPTPGSPEDEEERSRFTTWIDQGHAGSMEYLTRRNDQDQLLRSSVRTAFPWARSVIVCAANYNSDVPRSIDPAPPTAGWIARYAITGQPNTGNLESRPSDYHKVLLRRLESLRDQLTTHLGPFESRCFVDTGPVVERVYARYAGLGWIGKNTCLLNQQLGSWLFLGVIVTSIDVASDRAPHLNLAADRCGSCTRCIDACPTNALTPYQMDATRCIAYLTIEHRGPIPEPLRPGIGRQVFGCDICQEYAPGMLVPAAAHPRRPATRPARRACQSRARLARRHGRSRLRPLVQRLACAAQQIFRISPQPRHRHGQQRPAALSADPRAVVGSHRSCPRRCSAVGSGQPATAIRVRGETTPIGRPA